MIRDVKIHFQEEDGYYKPIKLVNFWCNNYLEYESKCDKNKNVKVKEHLSKIKLFLIDFMIDL